MAWPQLQRKPTFIWQTVLILLPIVVLAALGWHSLRQDKRHAAHEASQRAAAIAEELLPKIWSELNTRPELDFGRPMFRVNLAGELIFPAPCDLLPAPAPLDEAELDAPARGLWLDARGNSDPAIAIAALRQFLLAEPPARFASVARYELGLLLLGQSDFGGAAEMFGAVAQDHSSAAGESGLSLKPLAQLKLLELASRAAKEAATNLATPEMFYSNVVFHPSPLTPFLLDYKLEGADDIADFHRRKAYDVWEIHEFCRQLFSASCSRFHAPAGFPPVTWVTIPDAGFNETQDWLGVRFTESLTNYSYAFYSRSNLTARTTALLGELRWLPDYFAITVELGSQPVGQPASDLRIWERRLVGGAKGGGSRWVKHYQDERATTPLASSARSEDGVPVMKVAVYLTSPTALYASQSARTKWFGALILFSALAAVIGLSAAWRAFRRQQRLADMKSNFVSSVSHELRAPIASVRLMAESLERGKISDPAKQGEYFRFIGQECRRLSSLIENVLDFSRIEQGRKEYEFEPTDIGALVNQTVKLMEPYAVEKGVRLNSEFRIQNSELNVDGRAIQQALVNLIDNAIKHSPKGETVAIEILDATRNTQHTADVNYPPSTINISVSDHGPGIPVSEQEKIFERFYRLGSELRRETQGVGIGLSIVKHIVEAHGGRVRVESKPGQGSRFTIELPMTNNNGAKAQKLDK